MSLVGPRPLIQYDLDLHNQESKEDYLSVKPGITGLAQVNGRSNNPVDLRGQYTSMYLHNWSLWLDFVIILKTFKVILKAEGAY
jgi:undecaprenyl-phosphate galactose phosphotransferase